MSARASSLSEAAVRKAVVKRLPDLFGKDCYWVSNPPSPYGASGRPDIEVIVNGNFFAIELKRESYGYNPTKGLTEEQEVTLRRILNAGGNVYLINHPPKKENGSWVLTGLCLSREYGWIGLYHQGYAAE
jgi:hypothetical protein